MESQRADIANPYTTKCLPVAFESNNIRRLGNVASRQFMSHSAQKTIDFLRETKSLNIHSMYLSDLARCDLWLLFNLNEHLRGRRFTTEGGIDKAIHLFLEGIPKGDCF